MVFTNEDWEKIKPNIKIMAGMTDISYLTWINPMTVKAIKDSTVVFDVPMDNSMAIQYIKRTYADYIKVALSEYHGETVTVEFEEAVSEKMSNNDVGNSIRIRFTPSVEYDSSFGKKVLSLGLLYCESDSAGKLLSNIAISKMEEVFGMEREYLLVELKALFDRMSKSVTIFDWQLDFQNPDSGKIEAHIIVTGAVCGNDEVTLVFNNTLADSVASLKKLYNEQYCSELARLKDDFAIRLYELLKMECLHFSQEVLVVEYNLTKLKVNLSIINSAGDHELAVEIRKEAPSYERIEELALRTGQDRYKDFESFKRNVLENAVDEINAKTTLDVDYIIISKHKKDTSVRFTVKQGKQH